MRNLGLRGGPWRYVLMAARIVVEVAAGAAPAGTICGGDRAGLFEATP